VDGWREGREGRTSRIVWRVRLVGVDSGMSGRCGGVMAVVEQRGRQGG
jgi:hypothetical protein